MPLSSRRRALGDDKMVEMILRAQSKVSQDALDAALYAATVGKKTKLQQLLTKAGAKAIPLASEKDRKAWKSIAGMYESDGGAPLAISVKDVGLVMRGRWLKPTGPDTFTLLGSPETGIRVERKGDEIASVIMTRFTAEYSFYRFTKPVLKPVAPLEAGSDGVAAPLNWPSFRGVDGSGVADGQHPPITWNVKAGENVRWKTPIPGLGHSCPVVWGDRVFITTAISSDKNAKIRIGNYGDVDSVNDKTKHTWQVLCLDRDSGKILWTRTAYEGVPKIKRHLKGSQANCTPAIDGRHVVVCFGSEGLYCYDFDGKPLWKRDLSTLDTSFAIDEEYEWGFGNSPDHSRRTGDSAMRSQSRFVHRRLQSGGRPESLVHAARRDPFVEFAGDLAQLEARRDRDQRGPVRPRLRPENGHGTVAAGEEIRSHDSDARRQQRAASTSPAAIGRSSRSSRSKRGPRATSRSRKNRTRTPTSSGARCAAGPTCRRRFCTGRISTPARTRASSPATRRRPAKRFTRNAWATASYTASPVAADGRLYFCSEQGEFRVVKAGPDFELLAVNPMDDYVMATPAISNGSLFVRSQHFLIAWGRSRRARNDNRRDWSWPERVTRHFGRKENARWTFSKKRKISPSGSWR